MPSYEFTCQTCGRSFDKSLPLDASQSEVRCPAGHRRVRRIYAATPVFFKGSGFYVTDHRAGPSPESGSKP
jgi:putative FmdB family regulatory protein